jgi:hypothetical protein
MIDGMHLRATSRAMAHSITLGEAAHRIDVPDIRCSRRSRHGRLNITLRRDIPDALNLFG